jgi:tRNA (mo5U34)-methyltransferase
MNERFQLAGKHVLEVGCFEGVHTIALCHVAGKVTAIDSRIENVVKSILRTAMFGCSPTILCCNVEEPAAVGTLPHADYAHHVGVLYHLRDPAAHLLALGGIIRRGVMLDTHIATAESAVEEYESAGRKYRYRRYVEGGKRDVFSGMYDHAKWLLMDDLKAILAQAGFSSVEIAEHREERNGPRVLVFAQRGS